MIDTTISGYSSKVAYPNTSSNAYTISLTLYDAMSLMLLVTIKYYL